MILKMFFNPCPPTLILGTFQNLIPLSLHIIIKKYLFYFRPIKQYIFEHIQHQIKIPYRRTYTQPSPLKQPGNIFKDVENVLKNSKFGLYPAI